MEYVVGCLLYLVALFFVWCIVYGGSKRNEAHKKAFEKHVAEMKKEAESEERDVL